MQSRIVVTREIHKGGEKRVPNDGNSRLFEERATLLSLDDRSLIEFSEATRGIKNINKMMYKIERSTISQYY